MKKFNLFLVALTAILFSALTVPLPLASASVGVQGERFTKIYYFYGPSGKGSATGLDAGNAKAITTGNVMLIPANTVIENVYVVVDTAITGTGNLSVGDTDLLDGYVGTNAITKSSTGMYGFDSLSKANANSTATSNYLAVSTNSAALGKSTVTNPGKLYTAGTKYITLAASGTNTAGAMRVVVQGFRLR